MINKQNKKRVSNSKVPMLVAGGMVLSSLLIFNPLSTFANELQSEPMVEASRSGLIDVGQGIEWPAHVNAPFVDMGDWVNGTYSNNGAPNLARMAENSGAEFFKLGFIQATGGIQNERVAWGWAGFSALSSNNPSNAQYQGIRQAIRDVRQMGGDVAISIGGLYGITFWEVTHDVDILANTYRALIADYGFTRLDLDIETGNTHAGWGSLERNGNVANARALAQVQRETGLEITLTLPALPTGLVSGRGLEMLEIYLANGVDISIVNIMAMYFAPSTFLPGETYAEASIRSATGTMRQVQQVYRNFAGIELTDAEAFAKVGVTPSIGHSLGVNFTLTDTEELVDWSIENGLGMVSFWAMNRDSMIGWDANHLTRHLGITTPYQFSAIFNRFMENVDRPTPPEEGPEEPDTPEEEPDTPEEEPDAPEEEPDAPEEGPDTPEEEPDTPEVETWDSRRIYTSGDIVIFNGEKFVAQWWTLGETPGVAQVWRLIVPQHEDGSTDFRQGATFLGGDLVRFEGRLYRANWWTQSTPGSDSSWMLFRTQCA